MADIKKQKNKKRGKFRFNPETLAFEKIQVSIRDWFVTFLTHVSSSFVMGALLMFLYVKFFPSPKERLLREENRELRLHYELLSDKLDEVSSVADDLQYRDDNIYRMIFEAEPISPSIRKAGFGGVNRYRDLEEKPNLKIVLETTKAVDKLTKQLYVQSKSFDEIVKLAKTKEEMLRSIPAIQPIANGRGVSFSSGFGYRIHPIYKIRKMHTGVDWSGPIGTKIYATGDGTVSEAEFDRGYGNHVVINNGYSYSTLYGHLSAIKVKIGQKVKRGDVIGLLGNTGLSTGPHIHYEVRKNGVPIDPINYFLNDLSPFDFKDIVNISSRPNQSLD